MECRSIVDALKELIAARTGLCVRSLDGGEARDAIAARMGQRRLSSLEQYRDLLVAEADEWQELVPLLTTGETYFFRDAGQCALLEKHLLPDLIERNRRRRALRLWSAGCATGEEPYSLAMLLDQMLPAREEWDIQIVGTDVNRAAIERARRGCYGDWSFRMVNPEVRDRYFERRPGGWELVERIRRMVAFHTGNLMLSEFPSRMTALHDVDLILCRNVFIYFNPTAVAHVLGKFVRTLVPRGYLLTGHAELYGQELEGLQLRLFPAAVVYQRTDDGGVPETADPAPAGISSFLPHVGFLRERHPAAKSRPAPPAVCPAAPDDGPSGDGLVAEAEQHLGAARYRQAIETAKRATRRNPQHVQAWIIAAHAHANLGEHAQSEEECRRALQHDPFSVAAYYLLAHLAEERSQPEEAKRALNRVLYVDPGFVAAYLDLARLYAAEKDSTRAARFQRVALELLRDLPADAIVPLFRGLTAGELRANIERALGTTHPVAA